jgi:hypothetical protein
MRFPNGNGFIFYIGPFPIIVPPLIVQSEALSGTPSRVKNIPEVHARPESSIRSRIGFPERTKQLPCATRFPSAASHFSSPLRQSSSITWA